MFGHNKSVKLKVKSPKFILNIIGFCCLFILSSAIFAQIPTPKSFLGFEPADDKKVADWTQIVEYFNRLDKASDRVAVQKIGDTTLGKPLIVAFISSPENIRNLNKYREISQKLADPRKIKDDAELKTLIANGKTVVSISCSIHSTEIVASQMSMSLAYKLASGSDEETQEILKNTILLLIPSSNPDGIDMVADWYRKTLGTKSEGTAPPELYHHYAGHDNNRDWFMMNLKETQAITKLYWQEWFPQIVYDVHQQGKAASRFTIPPFFDPPNPRVSPSLLREVGLIGYKMAADLQAANISGVATNASYDTWWHGGFRSAPYYHNSIGILSEAASANLMSPTNVTQEELKRSRTRGIPSLLETATNFPDAWKGGIWRAKDISEMEMIASNALLQMAAKFRPQYLQNFYNLGKANLKKNKTDPMAFIIQGGQPNEENVSRLIEILIWQGIEVYEMKHELYMAMERSRPNYFHEVPFGSFIIFTDQPQRNNVLSLFENQVYPHRLNANGEAEVPYDVAGWTLPLQMGVETMETWAIRDLEDKHLKKVENINQAREILNLKPNKESFAKIANPLKNQSKVGLYKNWGGSMDEGWTRLVLDTFQIPFQSIRDADVKAGNLNSKVETLILPSDSQNTIVKGLNKERYPDEISDGIGETGVGNLKKFVEDGGTLVCFDNSCGLVINQFNLGMKNVLSGLNRSEFYCPGSILKLDVDINQSLGKGLNAITAAYFTNSSAFEITDNEKIKSIAKYAESDVLMSGWLLGEKYLNGKTALAEASFGKGKIILFAFRPQHRGQSWGTYQFIFNALEK